MRYVIGLLILVVALMGFGYWLAISTPAEQKADIAVAENFIDAFYSFDPARLKPLLAETTTVPDMAFYQGWAEGGHYQIIHRSPCEAEHAIFIRCPITVQDDLMLALGIDFNVTDTFHFWIVGGHIKQIWLSSNDLPIYNQAMDWAFEERLELVSEPCRGFFVDGPTPGKCIQAMAQAFAEFAASSNVPDTTNTGLQ